MSLAHQWPDSVRLTVTVLYLSMVVTATVSEYVLLVIDFRRYLVHPDRGGSRRQFHRLQRNFEEPLEYLRRQ